MRIPLDYYRILGLPIQATAEQLKQAHRDRTQQLPRREYSDVAIAARKRLIDEAYGVLSDTDQRQAYDMGFLAKTYDQESGLKPKRLLSLKETSQTPSSESGVDAQTPSIEIDDHDFVGALLILQELGEYEQVVKLSLPYLSNGSIGLKDGRFGDPDLILPDVVLTVALADLELGREQWQQGQYEKAAESLEMGQDVLLQQNLFASLRGEMQADLFKLRPYRILELLQQPDEKAVERHRGMQLLREMLQERSGIDGHGDDQSGLSVEDFLRFLQQLRRYLTTTEQQTIFETEARRPSAVATYLAVYALIAQGFANRQPALVRKAKLMLMQLGRRQDVHLEKAVCALLLGQTEEASRSLELSQEREPIAYIRENSEDSPDLLPGLCLYAERWLQDEVFPHFRDLSNQSVSLKDYFADEHVQSYLESLSTEVETANEWVVVQPRRTSDGVSTSSTPSLQPQPSIGTTPKLSGISSTTTSFTPPMAGSPTSSQTGVSVSNSRSSQFKSALSSTTLQEQGLPQASRQTPTSASEPPLKTLASESRSAATPPSIPLSSPASSPDRRSTSGRRSSNSPDQAKILRLILLGALAIFALWFLWWLLSSLFGWIFGGFGGQSSERLRGEQAIVRLDQPLLEIPEPQTSRLSGELTPDLAERVVQTWLDTKAAALGEEHQIAALRDILVDPALAEWVTIAESIKSEGSYRNYDHNLTVREVRVNPNNPNQGEVDTQVTEAITFYEGNQVVDRQEDTLQVQYQLVQQQGQWRIEDWNILR